VRVERAACVGLIRVYQYVVAPILPRSCRFAPSCSEYAREAIERHGVIPGIWLAAVRLLRCHPWGGSGYDPVPAAIGWRWRRRAGTPSETHPTNRVGGLSSGG
jgi:putative membrane protein insertion efficiency factor